MGLALIHPAQKGSIQTCAAPPIRKGTQITSKGSKTTRICLERLPEDEFKIAGTLNQWFHCGSIPFYVLIDGCRKKVWLNLKSLVQRFHLPAKVIQKASKDGALGRIVQLAKDKFAFQPPENAPMTSDGSDMIPMLATSKATLPPLLEIATQIKGQNRDFRLSKKIYDISKSILITRDGFIAIDERSRVGKGGYAVVKRSATHTGVPIVRRICKDPEKWERRFQNLKLFKGKRGVIDTLATAVYENKMGKIKAVSYHPAYEKDLFELLNNDELSETDSFDLAHDLLFGLVEIAKKGMHGDLTAENVLTRRVKGRMEAVIADLDTFTAKEEAKGEVLSNIWAAPETIKVGWTAPNEKRDVWPAGVMLFLIFQKLVNKRRRIFPWMGGLKRWELNSKALPFLTQAKMDAYIEVLRFSPAIATLLKGMLRVDPVQRWTAQKALDHFKQITQQGDVKTAASKG
jgi:hypothetical protein